MFFQEKVLWFVVDSGCEKVAFLGWIYIDIFQDAIEIREDKFFVGFVVGTPNLKCSPGGHYPRCLNIDEMFGLKNPNHFFDLIGNADRKFTALEGMT